MPGMNTGPSQGFMDRFKQKPSLGAGPIKPAVPKQPTSSGMPSTGVSGPQPPVNGPTGLPSSAGPANGMVRGPSRGMPMPMGMPMGMPGTNTGITGGGMGMGLPSRPMGPPMGMPPPMPPPMQPSPMQSPMGQPNPGIMQAYNQLSQQQGGPQSRRMMY